VIFREGTKGGLFVRGWILEGPQRKKSEPKEYEYEYDDQIVYSEVEKSLFEKKIRKE